MAGWRGVARLRHGNLLYLAPELDRRPEVLFDATVGAFALLFLFENPELVYDGLLLHLGDVGDDEDLAEGPLEALEGEEHVVAPTRVQAAEDLIEDEEA